MQNLRGDKIQMGIYLEKDFCLLTTIPKEGESSEKGFTREGKISLEWVEAKKRELNQWKAERKAAELLELKKEFGVEQNAKL